MRRAANGEIEPGGASKNIRMALQANHLERTSEWIPPTNTVSLATTEDERPARGFTVNMVIWVNEDHSGHPGFRVPAGQIRCRRTWDPTPSAGHGGGPGKAKPHLQFFGAA